MNRPFVTSGCSQVADNHSGQCAICGSNEVTSHRATEMMFGMRDEFIYLECGECGCLQLQSPPADMSPYYPSNYYSYQPLHSSLQEFTRLRRWLSHKRNEAQLLNHYNIWRLIAWLRPRPELVSLSHLLFPASLSTRNARVLDVGCGNGTLLLSMAQAGFTSLLGVDPFLPGNIEYGPRCRILARPLDSLVGETFDLIMFHHSLEHMGSQIETFSTVASMLAPQGVCLIRIPLASSQPWRTYGTHWVELDAPRHYFLHSRKSLEGLARQAGLEVFHVAYDSTGFNYWASELYSQGISLHDPISHERVDPGTIFSGAELQEFEDRARLDNAQERAGRGIFYLRHA